MHRQNELLASLPTKFFDYYSTFVLDIHVQFFVAEPAVIYQYTVSAVSKNHTVQPLAAVYWYITAGLKNTFAGSQYTGIVDTLLQKLHMYV